MKSTPDAVYEKYESEPGSCNSDSVKKTSQSRPGTILPIDRRGPYKRWESTPIFQFLRAAPSAFTLPAFLMVWTV